MPKGKTVKGHTPSATLVRQRAANLAELINKKKQTKIKSTPQRSYSEQTTPTPQCGLTRSGGTITKMCLAHLAATPIDCETLDVKDAWP